MRRKARNSSYLLRRLFLVREKTAEISSAKCLQNTISEMFAHRNMQTNSNTNVTAAALTFLLPIIRHNLGGDYKAKMID